MGILFPEKITKQWPGLDIIQAISSKFINEWSVRHDPICSKIKLIFQTLIRMAGIL
jgi:hypothetical protein